MNQDNSPLPARARLKIPLVIFLIAIILAVLFYVNLQFTQAQPGGTDFLYRWLPTRLILFEGYQNPYSPEAEYQVELMHHGHARQGEETPGIFAYPYYILPILIPFALIEDFNTARALWMTLLEAIHVLMVVLTLSLLKIRLKPALVVLLMIFALWCSFFTQPLIDGNPSPLATLFVLLCLIMISKGKDVTAGMLLALATIKPQLAVLFCILVCFWAVSHRRWKIILSAGISLAVLMGASFAIQPTWFSEFIKDARTYPEVASPHSPASILAAWVPEASRWIGLGISVVVAFILGKEWIGVYRKDAGRLFWAACLTFTLAPLSGISSAKSNFIAILPGFVLLVAALAHRWQEKPMRVYLLIGTILIASWAATIIGVMAFPENESVTFIDFLLAPILMTFGLFWLKKYLKRIGAGGETGLDYSLLQEKIPSA